MPELTVTIGGRDYAVACQEGEEHYLEAAAAMLDGEAQVLAAQIGRLPEARMLLMAGLMLADKTAGLEEQLRAAQDRAAALEAEVERVKANAAQEVTKLPDGLTDSLAELAARAEALAGAVEAKAG